MRDTDEKALRQVESMLQRCRRVRPKFAPGTAQHTLLENRIRAMEIARALLAEGQADAWTDAELLAALEPVNSVIRKCEKARSKYEPGTAPFKRFDGIIRAMETAGLKMDGEIWKRQGSA